MLDQLPTPKLPNLSWPQIWTFAGLVMLAIWGGLSNWLRKRQNGQARPFNIAELAGELCISGFAGVITYLVATAAGITPLVVAAMVGIAGHAGSRAIFGIEKMLDRKFPMYDGDKERKS